MKNIIWIIPVSLVSLGLLACSGGGVSDTELSLRKGPVLNTVAEANPVYNTNDPGGNKKFGAAYYGAPPMIPHTVSGVELNGKANDCLDCHQQGDEDTPAMPPSHFIKAEFKSGPRGSVAKGQVTRFDRFYRVSEVAGNRYDCKLCHAPQAENAGPLVQNDFQATSPISTEADVLDKLNSGGKY